MIFSKFACLYLLPVIEQDDKLSKRILATVDKEEIVH